MTEEHTTYAPPPPLPSPRWFDRSIGSRTVASSRQRLATLADSQLALLKSGKLPPVDQARLKQRFADSVRQIALQIKLRGRHAAIPEMSPALAVLVTTAAAAISDRAIAACLQEEEDAPADPLAPMPSAGAWYVGRLRNASPAD